jgi:hypothetical protein
MPVYKPLSNANNAITTNTTTTNSSHATTIST